MHETTLTPDKQRSGDSMLLQDLVRISVSRQSRRRPSLSLFGVDGAYVYLWIQ